MLSNAFLYQFRGLCVSCDKAWTLPPSEVSVSPVSVISSIYVSYMSFYVIVLFYSSVSLLAINAFLCLTHYKVDIECVRNQKDIRHAFNLMIDIPKSRPEIIEYVWCHFGDHRSNGIQKYIWEHWEYWEPVFGRCRPTHYRSDGTSHSLSLVFWYLFAVTHDYRSLGPTSEHIFRFDWHNNCNSLLMSNVFGVSLPKIYVSRLSFADTIDSQTITDNK